MARTRRKHVVPSHYKTPRKRQIELSRKQARSSVHAQLRKEHINGRSRQA
jgi:hypothetical protein